MNDRPDIQNKLVSSSDMASQLNVTRSTVSNWKKRYPETFPKPAWSSGGISLYWIADVEAWKGDRVAGSMARAEALEAKAAVLLAQARQIREEQA